MANEPWSTRGRSRYIGLPICTRTIGNPASSSSVSASSSSSSSGSDDTWWTPESYFLANPDIVNGVELSISGNFVATITLQRSFDDGVTWHDIEQFAEATEKRIEYNTNSIKMRLGVKSGDYTSGQIVLRLNQAG